MLREAKRWATISLVFLLLALGPFLNIAGFNTGLVLPQTLIRFVPLAANARIPGRAMILVYLVLAMLVAMALTSLRIRSFRLVGGLVLLITFDYAAFPFPLYRLDQPRIYRRLAELADTGAVLEVPFGFRDGFGESGHFDTRTLYYQTLHRKPLLGGFIARVPESTKDNYRQTPVLASLLQLSEGGRLSEVEMQRDRREAPAVMERLGIGYLVLNRATASELLIKYVETVLPVRVITEEAVRTLYIVSPDLDGQ